MITYPPGELTPHGARRLMEGREPHISYVSYDGNVVWHLMGPYAPTAGVQPGVTISRDSIKGLIAPWLTLDQAGANQDGITFNDAVYQPAEIDMVVEAHGSSPEETRTVIRDWIASWDAHQQGELHVFTPEQGHWWAPVRWLKAPMDALMRASSNRQRFVWTARIDDAFWRSYDSVSNFVFTYESMTDTFATDYSDIQTMGPNWPMLYSGSGVGALYADGKNSVWKDDPDSIFFTSARQVVAGPYKDFSTASDAQNVSIIYGSTPESWGTGAANDIWCRMGRLGSGAWDGNGVRARIGYGFARISVFRNYQETKVLGTTYTLLPPFAGNRFYLKALTGTRRFQLVLDAGGILFDLLDVTDTTSASLMGSSYRGIGFGMAGGAAPITQTTPGEIRDVYTDDTVLDTFATTYNPGLGPNWPLRYEGRHDAYIRTASGNAKWVDNSGTNTQEVVCGPYKNFNTTTNNQVVSMVWDDVPEIKLFGSAANDLWARMGRNTDGTWNGSGIRARIRFNEIILSRFNNFTETVMAKRGLFFPPLWGEKFTLVAGFEGDERLFKIVRNNVELLSHKEAGTGSALGSAYRGIGFGVCARGSLIEQATPARIRKISAGDNATVSQSGYLPLANCGDTEAYPRYLLYGPGYFSIGNGPDTPDVVEFGPLLAGQVVLIETEPRRRSVVDLTPSTVSTSQVLTPFQQLIKNLVSFASIGNVPPLLQQFESLFGILPPQGNLYSYLNGRFTRGVAAKLPGQEPVTSQIRVKIDNGNASSKVVAALTPRRRWPL